MKMSALKRKHITLSIEEKNELIQRLDRGEKQKKLADEYGIGRATIYNIIKNREKIETFLSTVDITSNKRQTLKKAKHPEVEEALYAWFMEERKRHTPITGASLISKAKYFYNQLTNKNDFVASKGWLDRFKIRYGIRLMCLSEKFKDLSDDEYKLTFNSFKTASDECSENESNSENKEISSDKSNSSIKEEPTDDTLKESDLKDMVFSLSPFLSITIEDDDFQSNIHENISETKNFDENSNQNRPKLKTPTITDQNESNSKMSKTKTHSFSKSVIKKCDSYNKLDKLSKISTKEAIKSFEVCLKWAEENNYPCFDVNFLKKMRDHAVSQLSQS